MSKNKSKWNLANREVPDEALNDIICKTTVDIFTLMQRNYELLVKIGYPTSPNHQFTFMLTVITSLLAPTMKIFSEMGLPRSAVKEMLTTIVESTYKYIDEDEMSKEKQGMDDA